MIYLVLGRRELGKTTLAYSMLTQRDAEGHLVLSKIAIIDPRRMIRSSDPSFEFVTTAHESEEALYEMMDGDEIDVVVYQPVEDDLDRAFVDWTKALKRVMLDHPDRYLGILVDEASFYNLNSPTFQWLLKCIPREQAYIVITAHQPKDIPTNVRAIADHWYVFYTSQQTDLDRIAEKSPQAAAMAKTLRDRAFVHWDDTKAALEVNARPSSWFVPLGA